MQYHLVNYNPSSSYWVELRAEGLIKSAKSFLMNQLVRKLSCLFLWLGPKLDLIVNYYCIMQIVRGGKVLRLHDLLVIHGKTFAIVQQFETPCNRKAKNLLENFRDWKLICENRESFPPRTICLIRYLTLYSTNIFMLCWIILENIIWLRPQLFLYGPSNLYL